MWIKVILVGVFGVLGAGAVLLLYGSRRWDASSDAVAQQLAAAQADAVSRRPSLHPTRYHEAELEGLPDPVVRFFRHVLRDSQPLVRVAYIEQVGQFRTGDDEGSWRPFSAREQFTVHPPGLLWDASIKQAPVLSVFVRDSYVSGQAGMRADVLGVVTVMNAPRDRRLAEGALQRYLAEAAWLPTALLPSAGVTWTAMTDSSALATLKDRDLSVSVEFRFNDANEISGTYVPDRNRSVGDDYVPTPWEGRFWRYEFHDGMLTPTHGEIAWRVDGVLQPYWRGRTVRVSFEFEE